MQSFRLISALIIGVEALCFSIAIGTDSPPPPRATASAQPASCISECGDVNFNGMVTSADVVGLVNHVFKTTAVQLPECADVDDYAGIDAADIVYLINRVFKGGPAPICPPGHPAYDPPVDNGSWVHVDTVSRDPQFDTSFSVLLSAQLGGPTAALTIPLTFGAGAGIKVDSSVITTPDIRGVTYGSLGMNSGWTIKTSRIDQADHTILLGFISFSSVGPASGPLARIHFVPVAPPDSLVTVLDTTTVPPHSSLSFTTTMAQNRTPRFDRGVMIWEAPGVVAIHVGYPESSLHLTTPTPWIAWSYHPLSGLPQTAYELECGSDDDWLVAELWQPGLVTSTDTGITYGGSALVPGHVNYCRIRVFDGTDWTGWSHSAFRLIGPPLAPEPVGPLSGDCLENGNRIRLEAFHSGLLPGDTIATEFSLFRVTASQDTLPVATSPWLPSIPPANDVWWEPADTVFEDSLYLWTAKANNGFYTSPPSVPETFSRNELNREPDTAQIVEPRGASIVYSCSPALTWHVGTDSDLCDRAHLWYVVERASSADFSQGWVSTEILDPLDTAVAFGPALSVSTRYWWALHVADADSAFGPAAIQNFRVYQPGDVEASWSVSSSDVITLVNYLFRGSVLQVPSCAGEVTGDGVITASDVIRLVNFIFKSGTALFGSCCEGPP